MNYYQFDKDGYVPNLSLLGTLWKHTVRQTIYEITGFEWDCNNDVWAVQYVPYPFDNDNPVPYTRLARDFFGLKDGMLRFTRHL